MALSYCSRCFALAAWVLVGAGGSFASYTAYAAPLFAQAYVPFDAGPAPLSIATGDLNQDGRPDLVILPVATTLIDSIVVRLGTGNDAFGPGAEYAVAGHPTSAAIGDLNGDGRPDVVVTTKSGLISVLLGNGDGTLQAKTDFGAGGTPTSVAIGDLNGDGKPDLAVVNQGSNTVSVLLGVGDGSFGPKTDDAVGNNPSSVALGDLNADGRLDVAVAFGSVFNGTMSGGISILLGAGNGTLAPRTDYPDPLWAKFVAIADLNGDGRLDLAVCNQASAQGFPSSTASVSVLLGNGDGTFGPKSDLDVGRTAVSLAVADLNGDGHPDLAVARPNFQASQFTTVAGGLTVLLGNGDGTFAPKRDYLSPANVKSVVAADFDGDGFADLACVSSLGITGAVLVGTGDGSFRTPPQYAGSGTWNVVATDLNGDGLPDVAATLPGTAYSISVWLGRPGGTLGPHADYGTGQVISAFGGSPLPGLVVADLNNDGIKDLAFTDYYRDSVRVLIGLGDGSFGSQRSFRTGHFPIGVAAADLNGDGGMDLVLANEQDDNGTGSISVLLGAGNGSFAPRTDYAMPSTESAEAVAIADLDGDGKLDVATVTYYGAVAIWHGNGNGTLGAESELATAEGPSAIAIGDLNGDDVPDLVVGCTVPPSISVLLGTGGGGFAAHVDYATDPAISSMVAIGDVNGDGIPDLVDNGVGVLLGTGNGAFGPATWYGAFPGGGTGVAIVDLDNDGRPDLVVTGNGCTTLFNTGGLALGVPPRSARVPRGLQLEPPRPNPSRAGVELTLFLPRSGRVEAALFDVSGRRIRTLGSGALLSTGRHTIPWDGRDDAGNLVSAGIYLVRARAGNASVWQKLVRVR